MTLDDFDFCLPERLIALRPPQQRDAARLLVVWPDGRLEHRLFSDLPAYLSPPDLMVVNDSRVIPARLSGLRLRRAQEFPDARVEITLLRRLGPCRFSGFAKPARRLRTGDRLHLGTGLSAVVENREDAEVQILFDCPPGAFDALLEREGTMPLPPYIAAKRPPDNQDREDYQTVYANEAGSIAAPTAGLHFTPELLARLESSGVGRVALTLHVGAGTFLPVTESDPQKHRMHPEQAVISPEAANRLNAARADGGRLIAVGTTSLRTLESAAGENGVLRPFDAPTDLFITPGYRFRTAGALVTNFHLPKSTLFMLVSAFMGLEVMQAAYAEAVREEYRFYSYGDACLLIRP